MKVPQNGFVPEDKVITWNGCWYGRVTHYNKTHYLRLLNGTKINASVGYKNLRLLEMRKNTLIELRKVG